MGTQAKRLGARLAVFVLVGWIGLHGWGCSGPDPAMPGAPHRTGTGPPGAVEQGAAEIGPCLVQPPETADDHAGSVRAHRDILLSMGMRNLREKIAQYPRRPYESRGPQVPPARSVRLADGILRDGWVLAGMDPLLLAPPIDWRIKTMEERSWNYHLHSCDPLDSLLAAYDNTG